MKSVCVYLGANHGNNNQFSEATIALGRELAKRNFSLIYGGSSIGMMGLLATTVKECGGKVVGIITSHLMEKEKPSSELDQLLIVDTMQERKRLMQNMADLFIVLPGGLGTLEEAFETWNAIKIGELDKKIGFLNVDGYFDELFSFMSRCEQNGLLLKKDNDIPFVKPHASQLMDEITNLSDKNYTNIQKNAPNNVEAIL